jgi:hypothetical protein
MKNLVIRKKVSKFSNRQVDEFLLRVVEVSGSLKNNTFQKYVANLNKSANNFHDLRLAMSPKELTSKIQKTGREADGVFRDIKIALEYSARLAAGKEQETAKKVKEIAAHYGDISRIGIVKKFADYDSFIKAVRNESGTNAVPKLEEKLSKIQALTSEYRTAIVSRDEYCSALKGKRKAARIKAVADYEALRDIVEASALMNGEAEVSSFIGQVNQALIRISPESHKKNTEKED